MFSTFLSAATIACSGETESSTASGGVSGRSGASGSSATGGGAGASGTGGASGAAGASGNSAIPGSGCTVEMLSGPTAAQTYWVAAEEPGASDDTCDGLAPSDEGGGHCPFQSLNGSRVRPLLTRAVNVRVELRTGRYVIAGFDGLTVDGAGTSEAESTVLTSRPGESAAVDVGAPDGAGCTVTNVQTNPDCVRQVVRITGTYVVVQGLTIQNGLAYDLETQGTHQLVRCNTFRYTADFAQRSDCLKVSGQTSDVQIQNNVFTQWHSQAIDIAEPSTIVVENNEFFAPHDADSGATGTKFGSHDVTIRNNYVHDLGADPRTHVFSLGGTGSPHPDDFEAYGVHVIGNRVENVHGILAQVVSCQNCSIEDNHVKNLAAGILISASGSGGVDCSASATGCRPSEGTRISGNRLRRLDGAGDPAQANIFVVMEPLENTGFVAADNVYCAATAGAHRFGLDGAFVTFSEWVAGTGTEQTSSAVVDTDPLCSF